MGVNTLKIAKRIEAAERDGRAAEEIALVFQEVFEEQLGQLVTKDHLRGELDRLRAELAELRAELKGDIAQLRTELGVLRADMATMEQRIANTLTLRLGAMIAGAVAVLGGLNVFF